MAEQCCTTRSEEAFARALKRMPGGVNSPVRAYAAVGGKPIFIRSGNGPIITDVDGNRYIDYVCSWGPLILGHAHSAVLRAVEETMRNGLTFGAPTELETRLAEMICRAMPSIEKVRMVSSGTEAAMSAIRLARGYTGRKLVVKFAGCYHGHADGLLVRAGSGAATFGVPTSPGVPEEYARCTIVLPYNNLDAVRELCDARGHEIACIIVEPVAGNMGVVPPAAGFLLGLREITQKYGIVLIFDEVITGFRVAYGGAQELYGVKPDMTILGKIVGGGMPVGAYGGRAEIMDSVSPVGPVYQAGTLSGNPVAMAAGIATLEALHNDQAYPYLEDLSARLAQGLEQAARAAGVATYHTRVGSMLCTFFTEGPVTDWETAARSDTRKYATYFHAMLERGVYLAPSQFEASFVSLAHRAADIEKTIAAAEEAMKCVASMPQEKPCNSSRS